MTGFPADDAELMRVARTVDIETSAGSGRPVHRTVIWIVIDDDGRAYVRSFRGRAGRWYRELVANPEGAIHVGSRRVPIRAEHANGDGVIACSRLLRAKYRSSRGSLMSMVRDEVLDTTLRLAPA
jgi:hypothetical protein